MGDIERAHGRFKDIVRGRIREDLKKLISKGEMIGKKGKDLVSIPVSQIIPDTFRFGRGTKGVGQGEGAPGTPIAPGSPGQEGGSGAGDLPGEHILEVDITLEELAEMLGEELELPDIKPKGRKVITEKVDKYKSERKTGPESLKILRKTYKRALKRMISSGEYDPENPIVVPERDDKRYRSWKEVFKEVSNALIVNIMDVSGSMGEDQKEIVRICSFWVDTWLRKQYKGIEVRYVIFDAIARQVDRHTYYHTRESGGTKISTSLQEVANLLDPKIGSVLGNERIFYDPNEWNIYMFLWSDGDNLGGDDTGKCIRILDQVLLPRINLFCYGQVKSFYGSGKFGNDLKNSETLKKRDNWATYQIEDREGVYDCLKSFLGKGK